MSYRTKVKSDSNGTLVDLPLDAETLQGKEPEDFVDLVGNQDINGEKRFLKRPKSIATYKQISYIQSSGTQYIKTGVLRNREYTTKLTTIVDGYFTESQALAFFGYDSGGQLGQANGKWSCETTSSSLSALTRSSIKQIMNFNNSTDTLYNASDDTQLCTRAMSSAINYTAQAEYPLFVAYNGTYSYKPCKFVLYSFKMYNESDELIRDFIPVKTNTGIIGLLDLVENKFYANDGTDVFVAGSDVTDLSVASNLLVDSDLNTIAFSGSYNDLLNKPTIPTVYNATLTIQQNGTNVQTFTANSSSNKTANIIVPTKTSDITNDSGYITNSYHDSTKQDTLVSGTNIKTINNESILGSGNITISGGGGTATDVQVNGTSIVSNNVANLVTNTAYNSSSNKLATMSDLPTNNNQLTNGAGYITNSTAQIAESQVTNLSTDLSTIRGIAQGKTSSYVINAQSDITGTKDGNDEYTGVTAITGVTIADLKVGDVILIKALEVPDYWVSAVTTTNSVVTSVALNKMETTKVSVPTTYLKSASSSGNTLTLTKQDNTTTTFTPTFTEQYTGTVTSVQVQAGTGLSSSTSTAQSTTLNTTISIASGYKLPTTSEWSSKQDSLTTTSVTDGTIDKVIGFDSNGNIVKATQSGGETDYEFNEYTFNTQGSSPTRVSLVPNNLPFYIDNSGGMGYDGTLDDLINFQNSNQQYVIHLYNETNGVINTFGKLNIADFDDSLVDITGVATIKAIGTVADLTNYGNAGVKGAVQLDIELTYNTTYETFDITDYTFTSLSASGSGGGATITMVDWS